MQLGQVVDFCIEYNNRQSEAETKKEPKYRMATPEEAKAYFGI